MDKKTENSSGEFFRPIWDDFDGELFQDLICDLLAADGLMVEPSGVGPDGGIDAFAVQKITFGFNNPEDFVWAVQCKFSGNPKRAISPSDVGEILDTVKDERFKHKKISGYFLATNARLSVNLMGRIRGLNDALPGFKTTYWDRSTLHDALDRNFRIYKKYFQPKYKREKEESPTFTGDFGVSEEAIKQFEELINSNKTREADIAVFLEDHPQLLVVPGNHDINIVSQPHLDSSGRSLRPDFLLEPSGGNPWVIVELKSPQHSVTVGKGSRKRFSRAVYEAIAQLRNYREFFDSPWNRENYKIQQGATVYKPKMMLVIGRDYGDLSEEEIIDLKANNPDVEIVTYTELLKRFKR